MLLTLLGNRRRVLDAAKVAKARQEGRQEGRKEGREEGWRIGLKIGREVGLEIGRKEASQEVADWYEYAKAEFAAGRDPGPPPILDETINPPAD